MIIDYMKIFELSERGLRVPPQLLDFALKCKELADLAAQHGHSREIAKEAFLAASEEGGTRDDVFARAAETILSLPIPPQP